ncbi:MAG: DUF445 domain-containing protein [Propioniciclava sp.]|uniref:DUF445 domain-containing protein n=1 Tax=Propioniciclava sp. TaxID=2038686 RepID=UPI0039E2842B
MSLSPADQRRLQRLRRMKAVALGLLGAAAVIYLATLRLDHSGVWGYVNTMAEAAMVGALADWFAVTALFRHPLGIPIPHTAIIPRKKDELAGSLQSFFADNFLTEDVVRERITDARLGRRLGGWLRQEDHARRVVDEGVRIGRALLGRVSDDDVRSLARDVLLPRLDREPLASVGGALLEGIVADRAHQGFVDLILRETRTWLAKHPTQFTAMLHDRAPSWAPNFVNQRIVSALYWQALDWVSRVLEDPGHPTRRSFDNLLLRIANDLQHDPAVQARFESLKGRLLTHRQLEDAVVSLWGSVRVSLESALDNPDSALRRRAAEAVEKLGESLREDDALAARIDATTSDAAAYLVTSYGHELSSVISHTIQRWDGRDASRRIEFYVGRDLQFIRINGTVVGALAGLIIHAVSQLV